MAVQYEYMQITKNIHPWNFHYLNWPEGGEEVEHVCRLHKTASEKTLYFIRHDQQGKGNILQRGGGGQKA